MNPMMAREAEGNGVAQVLYMALELSEEKWVLAFTVGLGQEPRKRVVGRQGIAGAGGAGGMASALRRLV